VLRALSYAAALFAGGGPGGTAMETPDFPEAALVRVMLPGWPSEAFRIVRPTAAAAAEVVRWAAEGILASDFPLRPHRRKCWVCGLRRLCPARPEDFRRPGEPPALDWGAGEWRAGAFSLCAAWDR
jgi:hypothetical protein